jgi:ankyrin repeat protein
MKATILLASVLAAAMMSASAESVHQLFAKGPDEATLEFVKTNAGPIDVKDDSECTTLHYAARYGRLETAKWLVAHKADVNTTSYNQFTPMHMVSDASLAQFLIQSGADLKKKDAWGKTPLQKAAQEGWTDTCDVIIASGYPIDLSSALRLGKRDLAKKLIKENPKAVKLAEEDSDLWGNTLPLGVAAAQGDKEMVELLLRAGAPVNAVTMMPNAGGGANALCNAVWGRHYDVAEVLCEAGANCNAVGGKFYPRILDYALKHSDKKMVDLLRKHGAKESEKNR